MPLNKKKRLTKAKKKNQKKIPCGQGSTKNKPMRRK